MSDSSKSAKAGFAAGLVRIFFFPLEMARLQLIISDGHSPNLIPRYKHSLHALRNLSQGQGLSSLYRGWYFTFSNSLAWGAFFYVYEFMKQVTPIENKELYKFVVSAETAVVTKVLLNPLVVLKTRVMTMRTSRNVLLDLHEAVIKTWKTDGFRGFYSGLAPGIVLSLHGAAQLYFYETLKEHLGQSTHTRIAAAGACSKALSACLFHPLVTVRYRLQQEQRSPHLLVLAKDIRQVAGERFYTGVRDCVQKTWKYEGLRGFYRGLGVSLLRLVPEYSLFFLVYEQVKKSN